VRLVKASALILDSSLPYENALQICAFASGKCYGKSVGFDEYEEYVRKRIKAHHETVIEHASVSVVFTTSRSISHELVRHRLTAVTQESQRFTAYKNDVSFTIPPWLSKLDTQAINNTEENPSVSVNGAYYALADLPVEMRDWLISCLTAEQLYSALLESSPPEQAREVLPNSTTTSLVMTANMREWRHIFNLRFFGKTGRPHPAMIEIMTPLFHAFKDKYPVFFNDLEE
jgi:thymidylate synthase (FAD)